MPLEIYSSYKPLKVNPFFTCIKKISINDRSDIKVVSCDYQLQAYDDGLFEVNNVTLPTQLLRAVSKRRAEYLAGRYAALNALELLGVEVTDIPIGKDRAPEWPVDVMGSITHTSDCAYAAVSTSNSVKYLGIDYEHIIATNTVLDISSSIIDQDEEKYLQNHVSDFNIVFTITFSAKESLFKALYPSVKRYFDFTVVKITSISSNGHFSLQMNENLSSKIQQGMCFNGYFFIEKGHVLTAIIG